MSDVVIDDRKKKAIKDMCFEFSASLTRMAGERDFQKEAIKALADEFELDKKLIRKMARIYHDSKFSTVKADNQELEDVYQTVFEEQV